jgi:glycosyltransferase involved in cell wall biosynthesis
LYNSIDPVEYEDFHYVNKVKDKLNSENSEIILGTVGRLYYQKDPLTLIRSFKIINDKFPNTKLIMVGDGPLEMDCLRLIKELNLESKILLAGYQKESRKYFEMFDIFMLSSHYEGMPYALLESMMMGIPAVGTDVVGIKDLIIPDETGYLAPEGNFQELAKCVIRLLENPDLLSTFSLNSKNRAKVNFNFVNGIKDYEGFYSKQCLSTI